MAKRKNSSRHGHSGDPRKRAAEEESLARAEATPELEDEVGAALETGHPIDIVMLASSLIAGLDPDARTAEDVAAGRLPPPEEFVRMFLDASDPRLHVLAWTVARLLPDSRLHRAVDAAVDPDTVPGWLLPLAAAEVVAAWQTTDPLRDSTDIVISLRVGESDLTVIGLVDFNSDGAVKDGFVVPAPLSAVQEALSASGETGMEAWELAPADARSWLVEAIAVGRTAEPPFESDSWPQARPLVEWALRLCPPGGTGWVRPRWGLEDIESVVAEFAAAPEGAVLADPADRAVLVEALHGLARDTSADPLLISGVRLELGLGYLWPTTLHHGLDPLLALPDLLGTYVRWAHGRRGIPADDTEQALAAIAHFRAAYVRDVAEANADHDTP
ncbi:MAG TPA: hypothetical protein VFR88_01920 [Microlunatus sp.]|nr:hypothetical protein [Microlunatus sp.]